ncbi:MAG: Outer rane channel protein [Phycisphaerales bacterium]|nr:Outer rane channel protein [Phycisphaerales bacterium]
MTEFAAGPSDSVPQTSSVNPRRGRLPRVRAVRLACAALLTATGTGCANFGTGGTGELVVPRRTLREVAPLDLDAAQVRRPQTEPATRRNVTDEVPTATAPAAVTPPGPGTGPARPPGVPPRTDVPAPATGQGAANPNGPTDARAAAPPLATQPARATTPDSVVGPGPTSAPIAPLGNASTAPTSQSLTRPAGAPAEVYLSLPEVRRLALANNLDLRVELLNPTIARQSVTEEEARYEASFTANLDYAKTDAAVASQLQGSQAEIWQAGAGLAIPLRTGGTIAFNAPFSRGETDNAFTFLNPAYTAGPAASLSVPLLRGFGLDYNAQRIRVAFYQYQSAQAQTKLQVIRVLTDAERVYWRLYAAREALKLRRRQHELALAQRDRARRQFANNTVPEVDVLRAESGAADQFEQIILAERDLRDRQRELKRVLNAPGLDLGGEAEVIPATRPTAVAFALSGDRLAEAALAQRMELVDAELQIAQEAANVRAARNELLPLVTLEYTYGINGLGPAFDDALTQVRSADFQDHRAGLRLEVPIGNEAARSRLRRSLYARVQRLATKEQRQLQVRQEVYGAVDALEANWQRILSARKRVLLAARVVEGEQRQYDLGRRTSTEVLDAQTRLADARQSEIAAVAEYQIAQVDIAQATGTVLGQSGVAWEPTVAPDVERRR